MSAIIIDGKRVSQKIKDELKEKISKIDDKRPPCLAVILVGEDPASKVYVKNKKLGCEYCGITSLHYYLNENTSMEELLQLIDKLNNDDSVDGILVQSPLPKHLDEKFVINNISPRKDVDAFHPINVGKLMIGEPIFMPCTPQGVIRLLEEYNISIEGKNCVVIGRSNIVGKPMSILLLSKNGTVTICHSRTKDLKSVTKQADILVAAIGKPNFVTADMVKPDSVVIDVGISRTENGLKGDVDFENVKEVASYITPVPGGVGPMTIAMLLENTYKGYLEFYNQQV